MKYLHRIVQQSKDLKRDKLHRYYLIFLFIIVAFVSGKSVLATKYDNSIYSPYKFPNNVRLNEWKFIQSESLEKRRAKPLSKYDSIHAGRIYHYAQNDLLLRIEMRYIVATLGNIPYLTSQDTSIETEPIAAKLIQEKYLPGSGFIGHYVYQDRAYLTSCINSQGGSTVTGNQFAQNRRKYDLKFRQVLPVFLGNESLQDRRCLWVLMSLPLNNTSTETANQTLETVWVSWFKQWNVNFPKH